MVIRNGQERSRVRVPTGRQEKKFRLELSVLTYLGVRSTPVL